MALDPPVAPARTPTRTPKREDPPTVPELIGVVKTYATQETIGPIKRAGRYVGYGAGGGLLTGLGVSVFLLGILRLLQSEWSRSAEGRLSWLAYVIVLLGLILLGGLSLWFADRQVRKTIVGEDES